MLFNFGVDYEELLLIVAEHKIKYDIDVVFIDNAVDLFNNTCCSESETTIKLKKISEKLNIAIIVADGHKSTYKRRSCYMDLRHKSLIKYADKIISINRPDRTATEKELKNGFVEKEIVNALEEQITENVDASNNDEFDKAMYKNFQTCAGFDYFKESE